MEESQWIETLNSLFMSRVPQLDTNLELIFAQISQAYKSKALAETQMNEITTGLEKLIEYQHQMKNQWASLQNPKRFKSILGLLPEYRHVNIILNNKRYNNPALNNGLYQIDLQSVDKLKKTLLSIQKYQLMNHTKKRIKSLAGKNLIHRASQAQLTRRCDECIHMIEEELEKMGYDKEKQKGQYETFIKIVTAPFMVVGYAGYGLYELVVKLNTRAAEAKESE